MKNHYTFNANLLLKDLELNKTFEKKNKRPKINKYQYSEEKGKTMEMTKNHKTENLIKLTSLYKDDQNKISPKALIKKDYIVSKNKILFGKDDKQKNKTLSNNEYIPTEVDNTVNKNQADLIKLVDNSKEDIENKTFSKDKTIYYSINNTFNNTNTNSNTINNTIGNNNNYVTEKDTSNIIKTNDDEFNVTNNSYNIKAININPKRPATAEIKNIKSFKSNTINNTYETNKSNSSYKRNHQCEYYSLNDELIKIKNRRDNLLNESRKFYLFNNERGILSKLKQLKNKKTDKEEKENGLYFFKTKFTLYSDIKRLPTKVFFYKGKSNNKEENDEFENFFKYNNHKFIKNLIHKKNKGTFEKTKDNYHRILTKGFSKKKTTFKNKEFFDHKLIVNSSEDNQYDKNKDVFGQDIYPLLNQKKILKNILPKEVDYNTKFSIDDIIDEQMHPLRRYQKRNLHNHSNLISKEINFLFGQDVPITSAINVSNIYSPNTLIEYKTGDKYYRLLQALIKQEEDENINKSLVEEKKKKNIHRKIILEKFKNTIKLCLARFKRLKISIDFFFLIIFHDKPMTYEDGLYFFNNIKDKDIPSIEKSIKNNYKLACFKDEFKQTALHICAKRNIYQVIQLLVSRIADIDAQDIYGRTPLMCACQSDHIEFVCVLLFSFADPSVEDSNGKRAIDYTNNPKIRYALYFARIIHIFNKIYNNVKNFDKFVINGLKHLLTKELSINYEPWLKINETILKHNEDL
jgi:ankyrin repeat protein